MGINEAAQFLGKARGVVEAHANLRLAESSMNHLASSDARAAVRSRSARELHQVLSDPCTPKPGEDRATDKRVVELLVRASR